MLLNFCFKNFMSFNETAEFSMLAPSTKVKNRFPDNFVKLDNGYDVQKTAVIVGENAGGKSNFVRSFDYFKRFFIENDAVISREFTINSSNLADGCAKESNTKQQFFIEVTDEKYIFSYDLIFDFIGIVYEKLSCSTKKGKAEKLVFELKREDENIDCDTEKCRDGKCSIKAQVKNKVNVGNGELLGIDKSVLEDNGIDRNVGLYVTKLAILGCEKAIRFINIMKNEICPETYQINYDLYKTLMKEQDDLKILKDPRYFEIFQLIDYSIKKIEINPEDPFMKTKIYRKGKDGRFFSRELSRDSSGVREFFAWAIQIFKVVYENKVVLADEMDRVLNPILSDRVISYINGMEHTGQFIFTSHNVLHLDLKNYMKEQIYFVTKSVETLESEIYSLAQFPEIRYETSKVYEFYLKGILGGTASEEI